MHEAALAQAALPAPATVLGLDLLPYSLGHELWLIRENSPLSTRPAAGPTARLAGPAELRRAVLICCQTFDECRRMDRDWLMGLKLWGWERRIRGAERVAAMANGKSPMAKPAGKGFWEAELERFRNYQAARDLEFPISQLPDPDVGKPARPAGSPFLLRVWQFLVMKLGLSEEQAWNYPYSLAVMQWETFYETEGGLRVANFHDVEHAAFVARMEAQAASAGPQVASANLQAPSIKLQAPSPRPPEPRLVYAPDLETRPAGYEGPTGVVLEPGQSVQWIWTADATRGVRWVSAYRLVTEGNGPLQMADGNAGAQAPSPKPQASSANTQAAADVCTAGETPEVPRA